MRSYGIPTWLRTVISAVRLKMISFWRCSIPSVQIYKNIGLEPSRSQAADPISLAEFLAESTRLVILNSGSTRRHTSDVYIFVKPSPH